MKKNYKELLEVLNKHALDNLTETEKKALDEQLLMINSFRSLNVLKRYGLMNDDIEKQQETEEIQEKLLKPSSEASDIYTDEEKKEALEVLNRVSIENVAEQEKKAMIDWAAVYRHYHPAEHMGSSLADTMKYVLGIIEDFEPAEEIGHLSTCCESEIIMGCGDMGKCKECGENTTSIRFEHETKNK